MISLCQDGSMVCLDMGDCERRDPLFSVETAYHAAGFLEEYASAAAVSPPGPQDKEPSLTVDVIVNGAKPMVRWRFGWWSTRYFFSPPFAMRIAALTRIAARKAEKLLVWNEERDPMILLR